MKLDWLNDALLGCGGILIAVGVGLWSIAGALIVGGVEMVALGVLITLMRVRHAD